MYLDDEQYAMLKASRAATDHWIALCQEKNARIAQLEKALASALRSCDDLEAQRDGLRDSLERAREALA